jgi:hypothetical protein
VPEPFTQRVPVAFARALFQRWNRAGELPVLIDWIWDRYSFEKAELEKLLERADLTDAKSVSEMRKRQGALDMLRKLTRALEIEGQLETAPSTRSDDVEARPPTARPRKRAGASF